VQCLFDALQCHAVPFFRYDKMRCFLLNPLLCVYIFFPLSKWQVPLFLFPAGRIRDENCFNTRLLGFKTDVILLREIRVRNLNQFTAKKCFYKFLLTF
jgi:hypothetical protein